MCVRHDRHIVSSKLLHMKAYSISIYNNDLVDYLAILLYQMMMRYKSFNLKKIKNLLFVIIGNHY